MHTDTDLDTPVTFAFHAGRRLLEALCLRLLFWPCVCLGITTHDLACDHSPAKSPIFSWQKLYELHYTLETHYRVFNMPMNTHTHTHTHTHTLSLSLSLSLALSLSLSLSLCLFSVKYRRALSVCVCNTFEVGHI